MCTMHQISPIISPIDYSYVDLLGGKIPIFEHLIEERNAEKIHRHSACSPI